MVLSSTWFKVVTVLTGLVIAGEALALVVGMHILSPGNNPWISLKNDLLLGLDLIAGTGLIVLATVSTGAYIPMVLFADFHRDYHTWISYMGLAQPFCANVPLFAVNSLKLLGLLVVAAGAGGRYLISRR